MNWIKIKKEEQDNILCINPDINKYRILLSPRKYTPTGENDACDTEVIIKEKQGVVSTYDVKELLLDVINEYDDSDELNSFIFDYNLIRFNSNTRLSLLTSLNIAKEEKNKTFTVWFGDKSYEVDIKYMISFIKELDNRAREIFNITKKHINEVNNINNLNDLLEYDITKDYSDKLMFDLTNIK